MNTKESTRLLADLATDFHEEVKDMAQMNDSEEVCD